MIAFSESTLSEKNTVRLKSDGGWTDMINGQTLFANAGEENIFSGQNIVEPVRNLEAAASVVEINTESIDSDLQQIELKAKFARLKKAMRRRSVSIF